MNARPQLTVSVPREAMALKAQAGHAITYRASPEGSLIYTVFTKKCQKRSKRGCPLFLTHFREGYHLLGTPTLVWGMDPIGGKNRTSRLTRGWGTK